MYLDHAATAGHRPQAVIDAMVEALKASGNASRGTGAHALNAARAIYRARQTVGAFFGAAPERTVFTSNVTEALNIAIRGMLSPGGHAICTEDAHNSVLRPLYHMQSQGVALDIAPIDRLGTLDPEALLSLIRPETRLVCLTHASNVTGRIEPVEQIAAALPPHVMLLIDTAQTAGLLPIRLAPGIDVIAFTGHKGLEGPPGSGGLVLSDRAEPAPFLYGGTGIHSLEKGQPALLPERLEAGTMNYPAIRGLTAAVALLTDDEMARRRQYLHRLTQRLIQGLRVMPTCTIHGDPDAPRVPVVSVTFDGIDSSDLSDRLSARHGIETRAGFHCAPLVHRRMNTLATGMVRFSLGPENTEEEIDELLRVLKEEV